MVNSEREAIVMAFKLYLLQFRVVFLKLKTKINKKIISVEKFL
jgi:hypothetical protein